MSDAQSLTLPKARGRSKVRRRNRKPPGGWVAVVLFAANLGVAVWDVLAGYPISAAGATCFAAVMWRAVHSPSGVDRSATSTPLMALGFALIIASHLL